MSPRPLAGLAALAAVLGLASAARAQDAGLSAGATSPPARSDITSDCPYWSAAPPRLFAAVVFESAGIAGKTELDLGYGRPHHLWAGFQIDSALSLRGLTFFGGLRAAAPFGSVRFGPRFSTAFSQHLVERAEVVSKPMLESFEGERSRYLSLDAEATFAIPLPIGSLGLLINANGIFGVDPDYYLFEDSLRVVVDPPFVGRARLSYLAPISKPETFRVGGLIEAIYNPGRAMVQVRLGPAVAVSLTHHLEAVASIAVPVYTPDEIGFAGADLGQIGLRYRWATGDLWPEFP